MPAKRVKGLYDSSVTRVWPVFQPLLQRDPSGLTWLPAILGLVESRVPALAPVRQGLTPLLPALLQKRIIREKFLNQFGGYGIQMEACFEWSIPPSERFLRWLIEHPERMTWPNRGKARFSDHPQAMREDLFGRHGAQRQARAQQAALHELETKGAARAHGKWWSFEGTTSVDCYLETGNMVLLIEGKRTETLSSSVNWYPERNQLVRNLEVAQEMAGDKYFGVLVIAETPIGRFHPQVIRASLPHFSAEGQQALMTHYLGCLTWRQVCQAVGLPYERLPRTVPDWIESLGRNKS